ncbi:MAG: hypothetical protein WA432_01660 [Candidatus Babeliaceae bacterium]
MKRIIFSCLILLSLLSINPLFGMVFHGKITCDTIEQLKSKYGNKSVPEKYQNILELGCMALNIDANTIELLNNTATDNDKLIEIYRTPHKNIMWLNCSFLENKSKDAPEALARKNIYKELIKINNNCDRYRTCALGVSYVLSCASAGGSMWGLTEMYDQFFGVFSRMGYASGGAIVIGGTSLGVASLVKTFQLFYKLINKHECKIQSQKLYDLFLKEGRTDDMKACLKDLLEKDIEEQIAVLKNKKNKELMPSKEFQNMYEYVIKQGKLQRIDMRNLQDDIDGALTKLVQTYGQETELNEIAILP